MCTDIKLYKKIILSKIICRKRLLGHIDGLHRNRLTESLSDIAKCIRILGNPS